MTDSGNSRVERLDRLFDAALELEGGERARFLASDAVDPDLRDELIELLRAAGEANPLERASVDLASVAADLFHHEEARTAVSAGQRIGRYRLLRPLGEGGTASVWLAERDDDSFSHKVAVKCLKTGLASDESRGRFLREQQILAQLQHPNIARLYDAGISTEGVPFIVMEWVDGLPLTHFCDDRLFGIVQRLRLFQKVCSAVAFAHQNLIVHRDLKPGNILVGADGEPKLLDFGIAKLLDESTEPMTRTGVRMLTPDYAAPEQFSGALITTATDVYSLGIVLYELLCGLRPRYMVPSSPHSGASPVTAPSEALRKWSGTSSSRDSQPAIEPANIARSRMSTLERLCAGLRGDLDTIVLKASQDEPARRYATVVAFNEDISRYLQQQPIRARPDSMRYRAFKFAQRHAFAVAAVTIAVLALVGGLAVSIRQTAIAEHERQNAEFARRQADQRFADVQSLAHAMIFDLNDELVKLPGSTSARSLLVKQALTYLQRLGEQRDASLPLRRELAEAWLRVGDVQGAPSMPNLGDLKGAMASYAQSATLVDSVLREAPADTTALALQAQLLLHHTDAMAMADQPIETLFANYRRDVALWTSLRKEAPREGGRGLANALVGLGNTFDWSGRREEALETFQHAQAAMEAVGPGDAPAEYAIFLGRAEVHQGDELNWLGRHDQANVLLLRGRDRFQAVQRTRPDDPLVISMVAWASQMLGDNMGFLPDKNARLEAYETARTEFARLVAADPHDMRSKRGLSLSDEEVGDALVELKRFDEAMDSYHAAFAVQGELLQHDPNDYETRHEQGNTLYDIARVEIARGRNAQALPVLQQTLALRQTLIAHNPNNAFLRRDIALVLGDLGKTEPDRKQSCRYWLASDETWEKQATVADLSSLDRDDLNTARQHVAACR